MIRRMIMTTAAMLALMGYTQDKEAGDYNSKAWQQKLRQDQLAGLFGGYATKEHPGLGEFLSAQYRRKLAAMQRAGLFREGNPFVGYSALLYENPQYAKMQKLPYYQNLKMPNSMRTFGDHGSLFTRAMVGGWTPELDKAFGVKDFTTPQELHNALAAYMFKLDPRALGDTKSFAAGYPLLQDQAKQMAARYGLQVNEAGPLWSKPLTRGGLSAAYQAYLKDPAANWKLPEGTDAATWAPQRVDFVKLRHDEINRKRNALSGGGNQGK